MEGFPCYTNEVTNFYNQYILRFKDCALYLFIILYGTNKSMVLDRDDETDLNFPTPTGGGNAQLTAAEWRSKP